MRLRTKITILLMLLILPIILVGYLNYTNQKKSEFEHYMRSVSSILDYGAQELDTYLLLKKSAFLSMMNYQPEDLDQYKGIAPEFEKKIERLLKSYTGFSLIVHTDIEGRILHSHYASDDTNKFLLPRDIKGYNAIPEHFLNPLYTAHQNWFEQKTIFDRTKKDLELKLNQLIIRKQKNSIEYKQVQQELLVVEYNSEYPPISIFLGGKELAIKAGLPFRTDTFLFISPVVDKAGKTLGYSIAVLDWTAIEDKCYSYISEIRKKGLPNADIALYDPSSHLLLYRSDKSIKKIWNQSNVHSRVEVYSGHEKAYLISRQVISAETLNRIINPEVLFKRYSTYRGHDSFEDYDNLNYHLSVWLPEKDLVFFTKKLFRNMIFAIMASMLILLLSIFIVTHQIIKPIKVLSDTTERIGRGDMKSVVEINQKDEIGQLARTFNQMTSQVRNFQEELQQKNNEQTKLINQLEDALVEIKTLHGLIPICSQCKKIRDDKGYWNILESYIETHSEATFSHGMCPECSDQLYGNETWYIKMKKDKRQ